MGWRLAKSLIQLRKEIDAAYPGRDKRSDGSIGDAAHLSRKSDHNPNDNGVVTAIDVDEHTDETERNEAVGQHLVEALRMSRDPRIKYVIYEGRMFSSYSAHGIAPWTWRSGKGHTQHVHISVSADRGHYDNSKPWNLGGAFASTGTTQTTEDEMALSKANQSKGNAVKKLQMGLLGWRSDALPEFGADGDFGAETEKAVKSYQRTANLPVTGVADAMTTAFILQWTRDKSNPTGSHTHEIQASPALTVAGTDETSKQIAANLRVHGLLHVKENRG